MISPHPVSQAVAPKFTELNDLVSEKCGGTIIFATDDWFAAAENLLNPHPAVWKEGFTDFGKWMDGWETRRKRVPGHDWCIIKLGLPGSIRGIEVDTRYFTGNYAPRISLQAARITDKQLAELETPKRDSSMGKKATPEEVRQILTYQSDEWETIVPMSNLGPGYADSSRSFFAVTAAKQRFTHVRLNLYPDGGVARLRVFGIAVPELSRISRYNLGQLTKVPSFIIDEDDDKQDASIDADYVDLLAMENGGICIGYTDAHYGHPRNLIGPGRAENMGDGWETARRLDRPPILATCKEDEVLNIPGFEWCAFRLGMRGRVEMIEVDTNHFKGNYADSIMIEGAKAPDDWNQVLDDLDWNTVLPPQKLEGHQRHFFHGRVLLRDQEMTHCRIIIRPDGGVSRIRMYAKRLAVLGSHSGELHEEDEDYDDGEYDEEEDGASQAKQINLDNF